MQDFKSSREKSQQFFHITATKLAHRHGTGNRTATCCATFIAERYSYLTFAASTSKWVPRSPFYAACEWANKYIAVQFLTTRIIFVQNIHLQSCKTAKLGSKVLGKDHVNPKAPARCAVGQSGWASTAVAASNSTRIRNAPAALNTFGIFG